MSNLLALTTTALDGNSSPLVWDLMEAQVLMPLQGFWLAVLRTASLRPLGGTFDIIGDRALKPTQPIIGPLYDPSGASYSYEGPPDYAPAPLAPAWVYAGLSQYQPVQITMGQTTFGGTIVRSGIWRNQVNLLVQAGKTQAGTYPGGGLNQTNSPVYSILRDLCQAAHVELSSKIDVALPPYASLANTVVSFQPSATLRFSETLDQLVQALNAGAGPAWAQRQGATYHNSNLWQVTPVPDLYHWRFLPDGTLWVGLDFYPSEDAAGTATLNPPVEAMSTVSPPPGTVTWLDCRTQQGLETYGENTPVLFPGDVYVSPQTPYAAPWPLTLPGSMACSVEHHWNGERLLMTVLTGAGSSPVSDVVAASGLGLPDLVAF